MEVTCVHAHCHKGRKRIDIPTFKCRPFVTLHFPYQLRRLKCLLGLGFYRLCPERNNGDAVFGLRLTRHFVNILATKRRKAPWIAPNWQHKGEAASVLPETNRPDIRWRRGIISKNIGRLFSKTKGKFHLPGMQIIHSNGKCRRPTARPNSSRLKSSL